MQAKFWNAEHCVRESVNRPDNWEEEWFSIWGLSMSKVVINVIKFSNNLRVVNGKNEEFSQPITFGSVQC